MRSSFRFLAALAATAFLPSIASAQAIQADPNKGAHKIEINGSQTGPTLGNNIQSIGINGQTIHGGSLLLDGGLGNSMLFGAPISGGPNQSFTFPSGGGTVVTTTQLAGYVPFTLAGSDVNLNNHGIGNASFLTSGGAITGASFSGNGSALTNLTAGNLTGIVSTSNGGTGINTSAATVGSILYTNGVGAWTTLPAGSNTNVLTLAGGVPTWASASGLTLPYGPPAQDPLLAGLFTISDNGASGYALGGQASAGGIGVVAASSSSGAGLYAQNTGSGIAVNAITSGTGPVIKATSNGTNDAIDAYGNVQILGTGGGGTGGPTNASLYVPYGDVTVGNHILTTDASGVGSLILSSTTNIVLAAPSGGGTDVAGRATFSTIGAGNFSGFLTVTYAAAFAGGSYPVAVVTPVCANGGVAVNITAESNTGFTVFFSGSAPAAESISLNYIVVGQNH